MSNKIKTIQKKIVTKDETIASLERQNRMLFEVKENQKQVILRLVKENDKLNKEIELLKNKDEYCPVCGDNFEEVNALSNCENVCCKCCKNIPCCDCEFNY